jgi:hypothetical protein
VWSAVERLRRGPIGLKEMYKTPLHGGSRERFLRGFAMECRGEMFRWCFARGFSRLDGFGARRWALARSRARSALGCGRG